ncbi:hypothetical protein LTR10_009921 [Elasticomyces elasticus]|uniref:Mitochondrial pyruvate carrier n=1 Tax=Elasticomyces elasticus TaxID=574655 RepID=A0AAN7VMH5_9PEZI|nr:hypothetical protein LTR10_009921 [Elasticomyces elasticus]KAK4970211.1 hypothetical protein LTR42_008378 [Elasticomyces elasticus]KAK5693460.1 hypothetical protein LTR97_010029 [Elasticomyces elasticus]
MAAAIKALNTRIRANPVSDYFCSTRESNQGKLELESAEHEQGVGEESILIVWNARRLLGPGVELRYPNRSSNGHTKGPGNLANSISGGMTVALIGYSGTFMRYAMAVTPRNYLLFGCHIVNFGAQSTQAYRYVNYHYLGGQQAALQAKAKDGLAQAEGSMNSTAASAERMATDAKNKVESTAKDLTAQAKAQVDKITR